MDTDKMGGPAFPVNTAQINNPGACFSNEGMTLWDYYAAAALNGIEASQGNNGSYVSTSEKVAEIAGERADAMLAERAKRGGS